MSPLPEAHGYQALHAFRNRGVVGKLAGAKIAAPCEEGAIGADTPSSLLPRLRSAAATAEALATEEAARTMLFDVVLWLDWSMEVRSNAQV